MPQSQNAPLIKLEEDGSAPVLRYNVPEPTAYTGFNLIRMRLENEATIFKSELFSNTEESEADKLANQSTEVIKGKINSFLGFGLSATDALGINGPVNVVVPDPIDPEDPPVAGPAEPPITHFIPDVALDEIIQKVQAGERVIVEENPNGDQNIGTIPVPENPEPGLYLVETLKLTSFLGDYGAGRVVKTFSLLPGEMTKISVKTFRQRESTSKKSSSILDSVTTTSADDFQKSLQEEQSDQRKFQQSKEYYADVSAKAGWGWGSASVKAGVKGSTNAAREEAVKNISSATESHSTKASAKRDVEINTTFEITEKEGEETSIERQIENINLSRTLNFVFRQMNQEFLTFIHLVDLRIAYFDGKRESRIEVPVSDLDTLLDQVVVAEKVGEVRALIMEQVRAIRDWEGTIIDPTSTISIGQDDEYTQFNRKLVSSYVDPDSEATINIPGVLLSAEKYVMRTEGVIVESILGEGNALDDYARQLQELEVERKKQDVRAIELASDREALLMTLVQDGDEEKAKLLSSLLCPCDDKSGEAPDQG